ncbi:MAG: hypothetical protein HGA97_02375 [Chlorobiaceae bacterium]|nr:hypothetical protein [Chlorobiaceae bacterium]
MTSDEMIHGIVSALPGVIPKASWGEIALFYNPGGALPNGVYFCTIKEHDGEHDKASNLNREGVFRLSVGVGSETYSELFGQRPIRPPKGGVVATGHDFAVLNRLTPHPVYAWMGWVQILSPSKASFETIYPLVEEAHRRAVTRFRKRIG